MNLIDLSTLICQKAIHSRYFNWAAAGDIYQLNERTIRDYPALLVEPIGPHKASGNTMRYKLVLYYFDRLVSDDSNSTQIYSNSVEILKNLINDIRKSEYVLRVSDEIEFMPFIGTDVPALSDRCCGSYATLEITVKNVTNCYLS